MEKHEVGQKDKCMMQTQHKLAIDASQEMPYIQLGTCVLKLTSLNILKKPLFITPLILQWLLHSTPNQPHPLRPQKEVGEELYPHTKDV